MAWRSFQAGLGGHWGWSCGGRGLRDPPQRLSMSRLEPLHTIDITAVILGRNFLLDNRYVPELQWKAKLVQHADNNIQVSKLYTKKEHEKES